MGLTDISLPSASDLVDRAREHGTEIGLLGVGAVGASALVAPSAPVVGIAAPLLAEIYTEEATRRVATKASDRLTELSDQYQDSDRRRDAALAKTCAGLVDFFDPLVAEEDSAESAAALARDDPDRFRSLLEETFRTQPETFSEIESELTALFQANPTQEDRDPEEVITRLKETFQVESDQEAIHLFLLYRELFGDLQKEATTAVADGGVDQSIEASFDAVSERLDGLDATAEALIDRWFKVKLDDEEGFTQLDVEYFHGRSGLEHGEPIQAWFYDLTFGQLHDTHRSDTPQYSFPLVQDGATDPFHRELHDQLRASDKPKLVLSGPECGKSTVCKQVAYEWVDNDDGIVFYRTTEGGTPFESTRLLIDAVERAQETGGGHPLIVVEDAPRANAAAIFEVIDTLYNERPDLDVSVLLDARRAEWENFVDDPRRSQEYRNVVNPSVGEPLLDEIELPPLSAATCSSAIDAFRLREPTTI